MFFGQQFFKDAAAVAKLLAEFAPPRGLMGPHGFGQVLTRRFDWTTRQRPSQNGLEVGGLVHAHTGGTVNRHGGQRVGHLSGRSVTFSHASHPSSRGHGEAERSGSGGVGFTLHTLLLQRQQALF